jgi:hypothetical protein
MKSATLLRLTLLLLSLLLCRQAIAEDQTAARVDALRGTAEVVATDRTVRQVNEGDTLNSGETVRVGKSSRITLKFTDGALFEIGPNGQLVVDRYIHSPEPEKSAFLTRILVGTFRVVTGLIGKHRPKSMNVGLAVATIGIRGTHFVGEAKEDSAVVILQEPEEAGRTTAVEVYNQYGSVTIDQPGYGTDIPDKFSPPSPVRRMQTTQILNVLRATRANPPIMMPR